MLKINNIKNIGIKKICLLLDKDFISSFDLVKFYLENIIKYNYLYGSYLFVDYKYSLLKAFFSDVRRKKKKKKSSLDGIPISIKDNIITKKIKTTSSSSILKYFFPTYNATVINDLEKQGLIVLGKLNLDEFSMGSSNENSSYKICRNPRNILYSPGGSSGGPASAIIGNLAVFCLATDTGGSIRLPASYCGILGLRPSYGSISRFGLISFSDTLDQIGFLCKKIADIFLFIKFLYKKDNNDLTSININRKEKKKKRINFTDIKIVVPINYINEIFNKDIKKKFLICLKKIKTLNIKIFFINLPNYLLSISTYYIITSIEAYSNLSKYGSNNFSNIYNINNNDFSENRSFFFGKEVKKRIILGNYLLTSRNGKKKVIESFEFQKYLYSYFIKLFSNVDYLLMPTIIDKPLLIGENYKTTNIYIQDSFTVLSSLVGLPSISIPFWIDKNKLPYSLQILGSKYSDLELLKFSNIIKKKLL